MSLKHDYFGGLVLFMITFTIALIELYIVRRVQASQAKGLFQPLQGLGGGGAIGGAGFGTVGADLQDCEELHKGDQKKIDKCKDVIRKAKESGGGGYTSSEQKRILTQATV